ncbi:MAG: HAD-IC family P-type ATPase, partial [Patescibacteria group bacterium]|nr:HAD-IC family P-type ATPase [Patescibacteria group bacterium]
QTRVSYIPGDSERKRSTLVYTRDAEFETLSLGAPRVIADLCLLDENTREAFGKDIDRLAERGYRSIALARARGDAEKNMELLGLLSLSDTLREDAAGVISFLQQNGIGVAMVTGDDRAIAKEIARKLNIPGSKILSREDLLARGFKALQAKDFEDTQAFAQILPEDKLELVKAAGRYFTVAANGDGVNDLPAVKAASVGFAVANAVDALKGAADIVLLSPGIAVMRDAFLEGRKIFARLYSYSLYRISESFRLIVTIAFLGILIGSYPLSPLQLILIALLNDLPIISLAFDRVKLANRPSTINVKEQFERSLLFGTVGIIESLILYFVAIYYLHLPLPVVQTLFFLKLTVSGHLLIYVAHTNERWWRYLPSREVIWATALTQGIATLLAISGLFMPAPISWQLALLVWVWTFCFMQVAELTKRVTPEHRKVLARLLSPSGVTP